MATVTLTARYLNQLKSHGKRYELFDALVPGLAIRVSASGRKTFTLDYRHRGRMRRLGLGGTRSSFWRRRGRSRRSAADESLTAPIPQARSRRSTLRTRTPCRRSMSSIAPVRKRACGAGPRSGASWSAKCCRSGSIGAWWISAAVMFANSLSTKKGSHRFKRTVCCNGSRDRVLTRDELRELSAALARDPRARN
jgi:hypothetical protein